MQSVLQQTFQPTLTAAEAAALLGMSVTPLYRAGRAGEGVEVAGETIRAIRVGTTTRWPTAPLLEALGIPAG